MNIVLRTILCGVYDPDSILFVLSGTPHIIQAIWKIVKELFLSHIKLPVNYDEYSTYNPPEGVERFSENVVALNDNKFFKKISKVWEYNEFETELNISFPPPRDIKINMMPYVFGGDNFKSYKLPSYLKPYFKIIKHCYSSHHDISKVFYLTIHESQVEAGKSQRRPGVHIDNSGPLKIENDDFEENYIAGEGVGSINYYWASPYNWGGGMFLADEAVSGGIFIASNVPNSCRLWDCKIEKGLVNGSEIIGDNGNCEHIKDFLPADKEKVLEENKLYWITDRTPHESLPLQNGTYRQFIRVVTANVTHWLADHSTPNPCGVYPDPNVTKIVKGNKFVKNSLEIVDYESFLENVPKDKKSFLSRLKSKISKETQLKAHSN